MPPYEGLLNKLQGTSNEAAATAQGAVDTVKETAFGLKNKLLRQDPSFDYSGVPDFRFRAAFSKADTDEERVSFLDRTVGPSGWTQDPFGGWAITPKGQKKIGLSRITKNPVSIDEGLGFGVGGSGVTKYDIADLRGDAPAIVGATVGGIVGGPYGMMAGAAMAGTGGLVGKALDELSDSLSGENLQPVKDVAKDVATEGALSAAGEGAYRGIRYLGRMAMAPKSGSITPETKRLMKESFDIGARPNVSQVTKGALLGRAQSMMNRIFGDSQTARNAHVLSREMARLRSSTGPKITGKSVGDSIKGDIVRSRKALSRWANYAYAKADELVGNKEVVPTDGLKSVAKEILDEVPKLADGSPAFTAKETLQSLSSVSKLGDKVTLSQMQAISGRLYGAIQDNTLVPGVSSHHARMLYKASRDALSNIDASPEVKAVIKAINDKYGQQIRKFDDALIQRIVKDPKYAGAIEPEKVVGAVFRKGESGKLERVMGVVKGSTKQKIQRQAMADILDNLTGRAADPTQMIFDGKTFLNTLDSYGKDTLYAMFGKEKTNQLYRLGRVTQFVTQKQAMSGGLVAANIALRPWQNFGRLVKLKLMANFLNTDTGLKWLTVGLEYPKTRAGADALVRLATQINMLADDEGTQSETKAPSGAFLMP